VQVLSTDWLPPAERFDFWRSTVSDLTMPIDVRSEHADDFSATVAASGLGHIELLDMRHRSIVVDRSRRLIRRSDPEVVHLVLSLAGHQRISQDRGEVVLRPGDMTMYSSSRIFRTYPEPGLHEESAIVLVFPRSLLPVPPGRVDDLLTVRFDPAEPLAGLVGAHMRALVRHPGVEPADAPRLAAITLDLVGLMLARRLASAGPPAPDEVLLARIQAFIERHLAQPGLTPQSVADAHHLSLRSLQRLFAAHDLSVAAFIRDRRLDRCRRDLADPRLRVVPVAAIAANWGLPAGAQFSRAFREAYGVSPRAYREGAGPAPARPG
jgi:AraC-like DNA-binding protein